MEGGPYASARKERAEFSITEAVQSQVIGTAGVPYKARNCVRTRPAPPSMASA